MEGLMQELTETQERGTIPAQIRLPQRGVFAASETIPIIQQAAANMRDRGDEWRRLRTEADEKRALAKSTRANLVVTLRVWGAESTGNLPIKTSAERQEFAAADSDVQRTELEADLSQTVQMVAREAYNDAQAFFQTLQTLLAVERDDLKREHIGPQ
jgi:hypothetical protein